MAILLRHEASEQLEGSAYRTRNGELLTVRHCRGMAELEACVELQRQTWGYEDAEVTPRKGFQLAQEVGGQVIGAFNAGGLLVGFAMSMAAFEPEPAGSTPAGDPLPPVPYLHSHMLAVRPEYRDSGVGTRLKLVQREDALARGIERMTWTFDPLAAKNAYVNLQRLGAIARRYSPNFYGVSSSRLQGGLPTDRLHAEWWLGSSRVRARLRPLYGDLCASDETAPASNTPVLTIRLPRQIAQWKSADETLDRAQQVQQTNRALFLEAFARGLAVTGFNRDADGDGIFELSPWHYPEDIS